MTVESKMFVYAVIAVALGYLLVSTVPEQLAALQGETMRAVTEPKITGEETERLSEEVEPLTEETYDAAKSAADAAKAAAEEAEVTAGAAAVVKAGFAIDLKFDWLIVAGAAHAALIEQPKDPIAVDHIFVGKQRIVRKMGDR